MWKVVDVYWTDYVNQLIMECGNCGHRFRWSSNVSVCSCSYCNATAYWHDYNGSGEFGMGWRALPVAVVALEEKT